MSDNQMETKTFVRACMDFFGKLPGQSSSDFMNEIKALSTEDRTYLATEFKKIGILIENLPTV